MFVSLLELIWCTRLQLLFYWLCSVWWRTKMLINSDPIKKNNSKFQRFYKNFFCVTFLYSFDVFLCRHISLLYAVLWNTVLLLLILKEIECTQKAEKIEKTLFFGRYNKCMQKKLLKVLKCEHCCRNSKQ